MAQRQQNPLPEEWRGRPRIIVKARREPPKRFVWEIIRDTHRGVVQVVRSSQPRTYDTMEAAYDDGRLALEDKLNA